MPGVIAKRLKHGAAGLIEFSVEFHILQSCAVDERAQRVDREVKQVQRDQQRHGNQDAQDLQNSSSMSLANTIFFSLMTRLLYKKERTATTIRTDMNAQLI